MKFSREFLLAISLILGFIWAFGCLFLGFWAGFITNTEYPFPLNLIIFLPMALYFLLTNFFGLLGLSNGVNVSLTLILIVIIHGLVMFWIIVGLKKLISSEV